MTTPRTTTKHGRNELVAANVEIDDVGGFFTGTTTEAALQELGASGGGGGGGNSIVAQDEGVFLATGTVFNFVGDGVTATASGTVFNINIPGGGSSGTSSPWTQIVDEDGSSFANWTSGGGTWSSDGTVIKQTSTTAAWRTAYFTTGTITPVVHIFEADVKMVSTGGGATRVVSLISGYDGSTTSQGGQIDMRLEGGVRYVTFIRGFTTELLKIPFSFNDDTFYKLRLKSSGGMISAYVDGLHIGTAAATPDNSADARRFGLVSYACEAHFKNIKMWELTDP